MVFAACVSAIVVAGPAAGISFADPTDDLYNTAQNNFVNGDDRGGLGALAALLAQNPDDTQALALQAIWSDYVGDLITREAALNRLAGVDGGMAQGVRGVLGAIGAAVGTLPVPLPALVGPQTGIVVLGYGLLPDGTMRSELLERLGAAWLQAIAAPMSPIVVTGGNPQNGISEGAAMAGWLIGHGIPASRVHVEDRAGSTVGNALYSSQMLRDIGANSAVVVTSPNHIRRAVGDFIVTGIPVVGAMTSANELVSSLLPPTRPAQRGIYVDVSRTFGLPGSR
ncbi:YdcF family protein [Nocardia stercoris]|uniref:YdcF family protein n=1 Tax=Nocardia stercoris TaxID=2483361 RepID=A0A3M2L3Y2_9NOCA|nr:YdcF family protein [Nocardia stercoris]